MPAGAPDAHGLLALVGLLLLPGLLLVRAPWPQVPFVSLAFWLLSWEWLGRLPAGRERFLIAALTASGGLALLRLLKLGSARRPRVAPCLLLLAAVARLAPLGAWAGPAGHQASFDALRSLLLVWHDGLPLTYQPLLARAPFGPTGLGAPALAADLALLSGVPVHRALLIVDLAALALLQVAAYALLRRWSEPPTAALAAVLGLAAASALLGPGEAPGVLALAFLVSAAALLVPGEGRSRAVAAGFLLAAAALSQPSFAVLAGTLLGSVLLLRALRRPDAVARLRLLGGAAGVAVLAALPALAQAGADGGSSPGSSARVLFGTLLGGLVAWLTLHRRGAWSRGVLAALLALGAGASWSYYRSADRASRPGPDAIAALAWIRAETGPLDVVCRQGAAGLWVPALAGRAVRPPGESWPAENQASSRRPCRYLFAGAGEPSAAGTPAFARGGVRVLKAP